MTYCVGMLLDDGLVMVSDSRTNAGVDYVTTYSKMHVFTPAPDRLFILLSAGNLGTTQEIVNTIKRDLDNPSGGENLLTGNYMFEVANYIGRVSHNAQQQHAQALQSAGVSGEATLIFGGQIQGQPHSLMLIYPQGNHIEASTATPYLQIGESKYGKPVLDRVGDHQMSLEDAARLSLVSLTSTAQSNTTVGHPFELSIYRKNQFNLANHCKFTQDHPYMHQLENTWKQGLKQVFNELPQFEWEQPTPTIQQQSMSQIPTQTQQQQTQMPTPEQPYTGQNMQGVNQNS